MNQLRLTCYLVYSMVCSLPNTDLQNLLNSQTPTLPQDNSNRSLITPVGTCQNLRFATGIPRVGFSRTIPEPSDTTPVYGIYYSRTVNRAVSHETHGITINRGI